MAKLSLIVSFLVLSAFLESVSPYHHHHHHHDDIDFEEEDCFDAPEYASCGRRFPVWTWDYRYEDCVMDITGGCRETNNAFNSKHECRDVAEPICSNLNIYLEKDDYSDYHHHKHHHHHHY